MQFDSTTELELRMLHAQTQSCHKFEEWLSSAVTTYQRRHPEMPVSTNPSLFLIWVRVFLVPDTIFQEPPTIH